MKPYGWEFRCFAGLALGLVAGTNPFCSSAATAQISPNSCSTTPCTIPNLFDRDLAELKYLNNKDLADIIEAAKKANKNNDRGCYPAFASITVFSPPFRYQDSPETLLGDTRTAELTNYLSAKGLVQKADFDISSILGQGDRVEVQFNGIDRDPPIIRTNSNPPKGTKVKAGQKITVHSRVSERFADGHKSDPTGVKSIQLIANGLLEEPAEDYGMRPPPCEVRIFERVYTVPRNPPPVIQLRVYAEDAVGHGTFEEAEFPTGDWYGTLMGHGQGNIYNDTAMVSFSFSEAADGTIKGTGHVTVTSEKQSFGDCVTSRTPPSPYDIQITGRRAGDEFQLELSNLRKKITFSSTCRSGSNTFTNETSGFLGAGALTFLQPKVSAKDGATRAIHGDPTWFKLDGKIELHRAKQN